MTGGLESKLAEIIADRAGVQVNEVSDDVDVLAGLGMDSLAFLDAAYDIDRAFGITLPVDQWMEQVNSGEAQLSDFFLFRNLVGHVAALASGH